MRVLWGVLPGDVHVDREYLKVLIPLQACYSLWVECCRENMKTPASNQYVFSTDDEHK
jgi:hypothetical protein